MPLVYSWGELAQWFVEKEPAIAISVFMSSTNTGYIHPLGKIRLLNTRLIFLQKPSKTNHPATKGQKFLQMQQSANSAVIYSLLFNKHLLNTYPLQRLKKKMKPMTMSSQGRRELQKWISCSPFSPSRKIAKVLGERSAQTKMGGYGSMWAGAWGTPPRLRRTEKGFKRGQLVQGIQEGWEWYCNRVAED